MASSGTCSRVRVCLGVCQSGSRETLCPGSSAPELERPLLWTLAETCWGAEFHTLGGESWVLGFTGNLFIPAIK